VTGTPTPAPSPARFLPALSLAALLLAALACFARPVSDVDAWVHLAAGRWIFEHRTLPDVDPFLVFGPANPVRTATVLKGQWLGQLALYGAWSAGGMLGVAFARACALALAVAIVYVRARRLGGSPASSLLAAGIAAATLLGYPGERPQAFAFPLVGLLLLLTEAWQRTGRVATFALLALTGVAWVNVHGSVLIAVAALAAFAIGEAVRAAWSRDGTLAARTAAAAAVLCAATAVSPNGLTTWRYAAQMQGSTLASRTAEWRSSLVVADFAGWSYAALVFAFLLLALAGLPRLVRASPGGAAAAAVLVAASLSSFRYHAFLVLIATPWLAVVLWRESTRWVRAFRIVTGAFTGVAAALFVASNGGLLGALREPVEWSLFPVEAMARLRARPVEGRVLAWFTWSGYVLWEGWPRVMPVVDPRMLDDAALAPYTHMIWATPEGLRFLDEGRVSAVLLPTRGLDGEPYPLPAVLSARGDWMLEYAWPDGILLRRKP
jgi:hypothetical protein